MNENELSRIVVDCCLRIHSELGPGLLESVYEAALAYELQNFGLSFTRQEEIQLIYKGVLLGLGFRADLIVENKLLIELKSIERLDKVHHKIVLTYLKLTGLKLGLLVNFNVNLIKDGIHRKIQGVVS